MALGAVLFSCSSPPPAPSETAPEEVNTLPPRYIIVFIIHGDGGYLYHDTEGNKYRADEEALLGAKMVAERNPQAEVFIFHEKRKRHFLFLFPRRDGEFYYYRNGQLLAQESFWRDHGQSRFDPEIELYNRFRAEEHLQPKKFFLYFGHEIPEIDGKGYDASHKDRSFTVTDLVDGLKHFSPDSTKFDLIALSTCFNGTPHTIAALSPYTHNIIASPGNLHLSYFDLQPFEALDIELGDEDVSALAMKCARRSFDRLTNDVQTEVSIAVYDVGRVQTFLDSVGGIYNHTLTTLKDKPSKSIEHCDCAEDAAYQQPAMSDGINVFFRPARFGRSKHKQEHSGWECLRLLK
ncbi:MAG TPA: clostripain-related cysteine peptidase [candidate division Zixibacteria bacterium]|nr:clostripain-related cysteine peptidase [candidate division Zixibacteria bacterium]